jgi:hypothetical protein
MEKGTWLYDERVAYDLCLAACRTGHENGSRCASRTMPCCAEVVDPHGVAFVRKPDDSYLN